MPDLSFVVPNSSFTDRVFYTDDRPTLEPVIGISNNYLQPERNIKLDKDDGSNKEPEKAEIATEILLEIPTLNMEDATLKSPIVVEPSEHNEDYIQNKEFDEKIQDEKDLNAFDRLRSLRDYNMSEHPSAGVIGVMIDEMLETTFRSAEAVVAARLAYTRQITDLIKDYDYLVNSVLALGEFLNISLPSDRINHTTQEIMRVSIPVLKDSVFSAKEIALITIYIRKALQRYPEDHKEMANRLSTLESELKFKEAVITSLRQRITALEQVKPNTVEVYMIKRQGKDRYLYLDGKKIKSSRTLNAQTIYYTMKEAEDALIYAINNREKTMVKKVISYQIIKFSWNEVAPVSPTLASVIKKAL